MTRNRDPAGPSVAQAERAAADAEAKRDALVRARERIQFERQRAEHAIVSHRDDLTQALADHIRTSPEAEALAETYLDALRQLSAIQSVFRALPHGALPPSVAGYDTANFADRVAFDPALAAAWRQAVAALESDPAAPLPQPHQELRGTSSSPRRAVQPARDRRSKTTPAAADAPQLS